MSLLSRVFRHREDCTPRILLLFGSPLFGFVGLVISDPLCRLIQQQDVLLIRYERLSFALSLLWLSVISVDGGFAALGRSWPSLPAQHHHTVTIQPHRANGILTLKAIPSPETTPLTEKDKSRAFMQPIHVLTSQPFLFS